MAFTSPFGEQEQSLRLEIPKDIRALDPNESDIGDSDQDDYGKLSGDVQSIVGVSIGREQTRLMSPDTPAAERAAAMDDVAGGGLFNGPEDLDGAADSTQNIKTEGKVSDSEGPQPHSQPRTEETNRASTTLRSIVEPKILEKTDDTKRHRELLSRRPRAASGPTNILADLNVKRFLSGFNFPNIPKSPSFRELPKLALPSIFSNEKDPPGGQSSPRSRSRSNTLFSPTFSWGDPDKDKTEVTGQSVGASKKQNTDNTFRKGSNSNASNTSFRNIHYNTLEASQATATEVSSCHPRKPPTLRRSTSDHSLQLRRTLSKESSLGDDSRWENVQDQVNSRFKAIVDSFQDSSIKIPSMPSLPSINLNSLRSDFTTKRPSGGSKQQSFGKEPTHDQDVNGRSNDNAADDRKVLQRSPRSSNSHFESALDSLTGDVVVMGGYRGSILRSAKPPNRQLWVPVKVGLNIRKVNLEVGLDPEDEENMEENIIPSGMLTHIGPVDIARRLLKRLRASRNAQEGRLRVHDYGYDWRLSPHLLSRKLLEFVRSLPCNAGDVPAQERGATVIAHSLGGLITRHVANRQPDLFAGIVYAGVPQRCVNILGPLRNGDDVLLSSRVLTAQVNFTFRTSFLLLPDDARCFFNSHTKEEYPVDFFDVKSWEEYAFSPCINAPLPSVSQPERRSLLGSVSDNLPSLPSSVKKAYESLATSKDQPVQAGNSVSHAADFTATKVDDVVNPGNHTVNMQMDSSNQRSQSSISTATTIPVTHALAYLRRTLSEVLLFRQELNAKPCYASTNAYPPAAVLYSTSIPTVYGARVSSRDSITRADAYDNLAFASGDGVCLARAAMLPKGYKTAEGGKVRTERGHVGLLGDLEGVGKCLEAIKKARNEGIGLGESTRAV
ncbi:hypothetical protein MMC20_005309 [Loxospora ochrophaea]|nr:hypothetical protein [Loxospora ochrophaea]